MGNVKLNNKRLGKAREINYSSTNEDSSETIVLVYPRLTHKGFFFLVESFFPLPLLLLC